MIWADRVAVVWGVIFYAAFCWLAATVQHAPMALGDVLWTGLAFVGFPWVILRGIDWIASGEFRWHPTLLRGNSP